MRRLSQFIVLLIIGSVLSYAWSNREASRQLSSSPIPSPQQIDLEPTIPGYPMYRDTPFNRRLIAKDKTTLSDLNPSFNRVSVFTSAFAIKNDSPWAVKDVAITCRTFGASRTKLNTLSRVVYEIVPAGKVKRTKEINFGFADPQTARYRCDVDDLRLADEN